jgi:spore coat protein A
LLGPAERADVVVDFGGARGARIRLMNDAPAPHPKGQAPDRRTTANIMEFRVEKPLVRPDLPSIPGKLRAIAPLSERDATVRYMAFREYKDAMGEPVTVLLNGRKWHGAGDRQAQAWRHRSLASRQHNR